MPGYREDACGEACTYDAAKAKALFDKAGGFSGTLNLWFSNADPSYEQWMTAVANQLKQNLGIADIKFRKVPAADYLSTSASTRRTGRTATTGSWTTRARRTTSSTMWGAGNRMGWENKEFDDLISQANSAAGMEASIPLYQQAEDVALAEMPMIPLWNWQDQGGYTAGSAASQIDAYSPNLDTITVK